MPLSFQSKSHGDIAFGFFNIESDMLLLENLFIFADDFCRLIRDIAADLEKGDAVCDSMGWIIEDRHDIGDLMGAIHGVHFSGFIGEVYMQYPFPEDPSGFKQNPEGDKTRQSMTALIEKRGVQAPITIDIKGDGQVSIGPFVFLKEDFWELIRYVWQGGYPRWKDEIRPVYVMEMKQAVADNGHPCFFGVF